MALRYLEVRLPGENRVEAQALTEGHDIIEHSVIPVASDLEMHRFLLEAEKVEGIVDAVRSRFGDEVRIVIMPVEATLPRAEPEPDAVSIAPPPPPAKTPLRVSRDELYEDIEERIRLNPVFLTLAGVSALVACIGLLQDDLIALIGAMVIAPLLGPNVGLALSTTLGDLQLGRKALRAGSAGIALSFVVAVAFGWFFGVSDSHAIDVRTTPEFAAIALALASGVAGGLAFTSGVPASLIGVMVAVALLPPLATGGMLLGAGEAGRSVGAFILLGINLVAVNLAGVATFLAQGVRPIWGDEQPRARRAARRALILWTLLLAVMALGLFWVRERV